MKRAPRTFASDRFFCERDGEHLDVDVINRVVEGAAETVEIAKQRGVMWNRFRHTWATRLAATGKVSLLDISKWMGNSVAICERHYAAYLPGSLQKAEGLLDEVAPIRDKSVPPAVPQAREASFGDPAQNEITAVG